MILLADAAVAVAEVAVDAPTTGGAVTVVHVVDGDTLWAALAHPGQGLAAREKVRLVGIDCPEQDQRPWGPRAAARLGARGSESTRRSDRSSNPPASTASAGRTPRALSAPRRHATPSCPGVAGARVGRRRQPPPARP
jgi:hypothetical protein